MNMKSQLPLLAMAMLINQPGSFSHNPINDLPDAPKDPVIPKGCKEYFFNIDGEYSTECMRKSETVFKCIASNNKVAIRKFNSWKLKNVA